MSPFSASNVKYVRLSRIDALRGLAVLLVICRHWPVNNYLGNLGWLGVDLFFVISGFLISGLLFSEYDKAGTIDFTRFFIRRGLKIYPLFFLLIVCSWMVAQWGGYGPDVKNYLKEWLFVQNYFGGVYVHTWSLAVEEHFYLLLILCFALLSAKKKRLPVVFLFFILAPLGFRLWRAAHGEANNHFFTHTRIDSLFMGTLLCYAWRYHKHKFSFMHGTTRYLILAICLAAISIFGLVPPELIFVQGIGFTLIALAFAGVLLFALTTQNKKTSWTKPVSFVGFYSYSVYLLHIPIKIVLEYFGFEEKTDGTNVFYFLIYVLLCVVAGVAFSEMIEQPILRWRDKKIPSKA